MLYRGLNVALIAPCCNEQAAIARVICDFRAAMPGLDVFVFDNRSTDATAEVAGGRHETKRPAYPAIPHPTEMWGKP
jgi:hypothetical protein